jgi:hypothetical protein
MERSPSNACAYGVRSQTIAQPQKRDRSPQPQHPNRSPKHPINRGIGGKFVYLAKLLSKLLSSGREK